MTELLLRLTMPSSRPTTEFRNETHVLPAIGKLPRIIRAFIGE